MPGWLFWKYKPVFFLQLGRMFVGSLRDGEATVFLKAFFKAVKQIPSTLKKRSVIQRSRKVTTGYIDSILYHGRPPKIPKL